MVTGMGEQTNERYMIIDTEIGTRSRALFSSAVSCGTMILWY